MEVLHQEMELFHQGMNRLQEMCLASFLVKKRLKRWHNYPRLFNDIAHTQWPPCHRNNTRRHQPKPISTWTSWYWTLPQCQSRCRHVRSWPNCSSGDWWHWTNDTDQDNCVSLVQLSKQSEHYLFAYRSSVCTTISGGTALRSSAELILQYWLCQMTAPSPVFY